MKVLLPSILTLEAIVVALAIPVALTLGGHGALAGWTLGVLAVLLLLGAGLVRRPHGLAIGWALQVLVVLSGFVVPAMALLGLVFLGVWVLGVVYGSKADLARARAQAAAAGDRTGPSGDGEPTTAG